MRRIVFIIPLVVLLGLCGCHSTQSLQTEKTEIRDSVRIKDSVNIKDSLVIKTSIKDSVRIKDSTVIHLDSSGNVVNKETWHERDHYHSQSDSLTQYKLMLKEALLERDKALQLLSQKEETVVRKPTLREKLELILTGIMMAGCGVLVWWLMRKDFYRREENRHQ